MKRGQSIEPETRVGICCGCHSDGQSLFKVPGIFRYRCDPCFEREVGQRHHLAPVHAPRILVLP